MHISPQSLRRSFTRIPSEWCPRGLFSKPSARSRPFSQEMPHKTQQPSTYRPLSCPTNSVRSVERLSAHKLTPKTITLKPFLAENLEFARCDHDEFECHNAQNQCISRYTICDRVNDCDNGNDEADRLCKCASNQVSCLSWRRPHITHSKSENTFPGSQFDQIASFALCCVRSVWGGNRMGQWTVQVQNRRRMCG